MTATPHANASPRHDPSSPTSRDTPQPFARFHQLLHAGNYDALVGRGLRRTLRAAAADPSLDPEIGALRLALTRLLNEEQDPARLAAGVARISSVAIQAARFRAGTDTGADEIRQALLRDLEDYERELALQSPQPPELIAELLIDRD